MISRRYLFWMLVILGTASIFISPISSILGYDGPLSISGYILFPVFVVLAIAAAYKNRHVRFDAGDDGIRVSGGFTDVKISCSAIDSVEFKDDMNYGAREAGMETIDFISGDFCNKEFGAYKVIAYAGQKRCIVIRYEGKIFVFNLSTGDETDDAYHAIMSKMG